MTKKLKEAALTTGEGRIVSCLEGGYNLRALAAAARAHVQAML
jgi:acetoin utilization deacetylase AcuC-like enzyme